MSTPTHLLLRKLSNSRLHRTFSASVVKFKPNISATDVSFPTQNDQSRKYAKKFEGPSLEHFIANSKSFDSSVIPADIQETIPYVQKSAYDGQNRRVYFDVFGCQMNVNDTEVAWSILKENGFQRTLDIKKADVVLIMTCSIREGAEQKIWQRLNYLQGLKRYYSKRHDGATLKVGVLGCMAERLKETIIEKEKTVDLVCGPDAYRDLPRMLAVTSAGQNAVNVLLSLEETYADVVPVRLNEDTKTAYVSIMRGCDNMCTYCIVPFTRGRERSRPIDSIVEEVKILSDQGIKEVTLLGQNVNSYRDTSDSQFFGSSTSSDPTKLSSTGFKTVYKPKKGGRRFCELLDKVSLVDPEMRIRFTSPHPKDFPDEVLQLIKERPNICKQIHLPAQSGNNKVLEDMRRGYTREAYIELVNNIRTTLPNVSLSSDFIAGFCGETEEAHQETLDLMDQIKYNFAYCFPYSMRQKTTAHRRLTDDVPLEVKKRRTVELLDMFIGHAYNINSSQIGSNHIMLVESDSKRSSDHLAGRNEGNTLVVIPKMEIPCEQSSKILRKINPGDYVVVQITKVSSHTLQAVPLYHTTLRDYVNQEDSIDQREIAIQGS